MVANKSVEGVMGGGWQSEDDAAHLHAAGEAAAAEAEAQAEQEKHKDTLIHLGLIFRAVAEYYGFQTLHKYYEECDKLAEVSPVGLLRETPEYLILVEEQEKIARSFDGSKSGPTWTVKKLRFKRKGGRK